MKTVDYKHIDALMIDTGERDMMELLTDEELARFMRALINKADGKPYKELEYSDFSNKAIGGLAKMFFMRCIDRLEYYRGKKNAALKRWKKNKEGE